MHWMGGRGGGPGGPWGVGGARIPRDGLHYQAVVAAVKRMECSYENEVGIIDWVGKVFIPAY